MSDSQLNAAALQETARTLATMAGIGTSTAAELLNKRIVITTDDSNRAAITLADEVELLLARTFASVSRSSYGPADLHILVGSTKSRERIPTLRIDWNLDKIVIGTEAQTLSMPENQHPLFLLVGACYAAAAATKVLTGRAIAQPLPDPLIIKFDQLGIERDCLSRPIVLSDTYMAGAGAIGNGLLRALRYVDARGELNIADNDFVDDTNLQRQVYFTNHDIGKPKATTLASNAQSHFPRLELIPHECRLQALRVSDNGCWLKRLIVCVDSRRARRQLQDEIAGEVFDASTTDIREVILHYHKQPTVDACMSCIYYADDRELERGDLLADALGLSVEQVRLPEINPQMAETIIQHLSLECEPTQLIGLPCDTLFKQFCGEGLLNVAPDKQILAPFAFVSVLAGTLLAIELVRRLAGTRCYKDNFWRVSAWAPPIPLLRTRRRRRDDCAFCEKLELLDASKFLWGSTDNSRELLFSGQNAQ